MALILNIETATDIGSVCLSQKNTILALQKSDTSFAHAEETTLLIEACLSEAGVAMHDLSAVAISSGPGSYTALRIGTSVAKGICYALNKPLIAIDTLEALALAATKEETGDYYLPMIDARRMEVYTAFFDTAIQCIEPTHALILDEKVFNRAIFDQKKLVFVGNGAEKVKKVATKPTFTFVELTCSAEHLAPLARQKYRTKQFESVAYFEPNYLKPPNITTPKKIL